ncbi:hypothetical protein T06_10027 [Trichinella sp. T6]|nr:hypothetical protein T06_10027 [Trichinella sp. T6]
MLVRVDSVLIRFVVKCEIWQQAEQNLMHKKVKVWIRCVQVQIHEVHKRRTNCPKLKLSSLRKRFTDIVFLYFYMLIIQHVLIVEHVHHVFLIISYFLQSTALNNFVKLSGVTNAFDLSKSTLPQVLHAFKADRLAFCESSRLQIIQNH